MHGCITIADRNTSRWKSGQFKRVRLDLVEMGGTMMIIDPVEIVNISFGGHSLELPIN